MAEIIDKPPMCPVDNCTRVMDVDRVPGVNGESYGGRQLRKPELVYYRCPVHGRQKRPR